MGFEVNCFLKNVSVIKIEVIVQIAKYFISSIKRPRRLVNFETVRRGAYYRVALISKLGK